MARRLQRIVGLSAYTPSRLRIARIVEKLPPASGGKEIHVAELTRALRDARVDSTVFFRAGELLPRCESVCMRDISQNRYRFAAWAVRAVARAHARAPFDAIHAHGDIPEALAAMVLSVRLRIPAVLTVHGGLSRHRVHHAARLPLFSSMQRIVAVSQDIADDLRRIGVSAPIAVRPSGVRDIFFDMRTAPFDPPTVIAVGRLAPVKGYETIAAAAPLVPSANWVVLGDGGDEYASRIRRELQEAGVAVRHERDPRALAREMAGAAALVLTSVDLPGEREGFPTAALEALATGTPIVASESSGLARFASEGAPVKIFSRTGARSLADAVRQTLADGRPDRRVTATFASPWSDVAVFTRTLYERAIEEGAQRAAVFATAWLETGGAEHLMLALASNAVARGHRVAVAGAPGSLVEHRPANTDYIPLRLGNSPLSMTYNTLALAGAFARLRPQVVNSHHFPTGVSGRLAQMLVRAGARNVLTVHVPEKRRSEAIIGALAPLLFDRVLPVAESVQRDIARFAPSPLQNRITVVRAGVSATQPAKEHSHTVGVVARLVERKGHRHLLHAIGLMAQDGLLDDWHFELWGDGPLANDLQDLAQALDVRQHVTFSGSVPNAAASLHRCSVIVLPSTREGLPLMLIEAMAAGCAIVATRLPGVEELVGESGAAVLVPPADDRALATGLTRVLSSSDLRSQLSQAARRRYREAFTLSQMTNEYASILELDSPCAPSAHSRLETANSR